MSQRPLMMTPWFLALAALCAYGEDQVPFPNLAPTVGGYLEKDYYDHSRFQPHLMVERALRAIETTEPSLDTTWAGNVIALTIGTVTQNIAAEEPKTLAEAMTLIERVRLELDKSALPTTRKRDLVYNMVNGALTCLDPHTVIMAPEPAKDFRDDIAGEFYGIGAFLHQEEGRVSIERVMPGLPADKAGVEDGDVILGIDGEKTAGLSLDQAVHRIKGPKGTSVTLTIERKSAAGAIDIPITRDLVQVITMRSHRTGDVGYVRMDEFNGYTARDLYHAIQDLQKAGPLKAFVLDLRFNGGGLLDQSRLVSDFFLPKGDEIVRTVTVDGQPQIYKSSSRQILDAPMVVITSGGSASAAEILSGCLQCNDRAVVIGTTSFGKGSVQTVKDLSDGSRLKLTIQEYQLPGGVSIQDVGVNPDVKLVQHTVRKDGSIDLLPFSGNREADDEFALKNRKAYEHHATYELGWLSKYLPTEELRKSGIASKEFVPDQEATLIIDLLSQTVVGQDFTTGALQASKEHKARQYLLERLKPAVMAKRDSESAILAEALAKRMPAVTWGAADPAPAGMISLSYTGPATIAAGEDKELTFVVKNAGSAPIGRLYGIVKADKFSPFWEDEVIFGEVAAGQSGSGVLRFKVPPRAYSGEERFELELFHDGQVERLASIPVRVAIQAQPRPHLGYSWKMDDQSGNSQLKPGEANSIQLTLVNDGDGPTTKLDLRVFKDNDPYVQLGENRNKLDPLPKGGSVTIKVPITVLKEVKRGDKLVPFAASCIKLQVRAEERFEEQDGRFRATLFHALAIPVNAPLAPHPVHQPLLALTGVEVLGNNQVKISVKVEDANLRFLTTFLDEDKVDLVPASKLSGDGIYTAKLTLKPGANAVRVIGFDEDEVDEILPIRLWGEGQVPTPATAATKPAADKSADKTPAKKGIIIP